MPFLDLEEELAELGYGTAVDRRSLFNGGFLLRGGYDYEAIPKELQKKRGPKPRLTAEEKAERKRASRKRKQKEARSDPLDALVQKRINGMACRRYGRMKQFEKTLERLGWSGSFAMILHGRSTGTETVTPRDAFEAKTELGRAARIDFMVYAYVPQRWSIIDIAKLLKLTPEEVADSVRSRNFFVPPLKGR